jgi:outer membrane protein OmpA-like peptidoglycan-associated protein
MNKRIIFAGIAISAFAALPAYGGFQLIQTSPPKKSAENPQPKADLPAADATNHNEPVAPPPSVQQEAVAARSSSSSLTAMPEPAMPEPAMPEPAMPEPANTYLAEQKAMPQVIQAPQTAAPGQDSQPFLSVGNLQAESERIQAQIEKLRSDLELVKTALAIAQSNKNPNIPAINHSIDRLEKRVAQQVADAGMVTMDFKFGPGSAKFRTTISASRKLVRAAKGASKIVIIGHTDKADASDQNYSIALERAAAIKKYLERKGVDPEKISTTSHGSTQIAAVNPASGERSANSVAEVRMSNRQEYAARN